MCDKRVCDCQRPEKLKGKPRDCTSEQIKKCHGDVNDHPCVISDKSD
ncbi:MAG: hypothetical protein SVZ03_11905 [Spirochaetota bacterium]|nr:hypothetical protein [Spirochaetota bacterium]